MFTSDEVALFEREFAELVGARYAVLLNSCTTAIYAALIAAGVGPGSIVAAPAFTYVGTCLPVAALGAKLVLVDIDPPSQSLNLDSLRSTLRRNKVEAVIHVHLFGKAWNSGLVAQLCRQHGAKYISDAAQLLGIRQETANLASLGPACFSFGDSKLLRLGEGGAVACNDEDTAEAVRKARHEGEVWLRLGKSRGEGFHPTPSDVLSNLATVSPGLNYRPTAFTAALGRVMLKDLPQFLGRTRSNADLLTQGLQSLRGVTLPVPEHRTWWTFPILLDPKIFSRDVTLACLLAEGIPAGVHFPRLISQHPLVAQHVLNLDEPMAGAEQFSQNHIVLPIYPALQAEHVHLIVSAVRKVLSRVQRSPGRLSKASREFLDSRKVACLSSGLFIFLRDQN
jgi:dTDP-4-amino-4,6-dideoxygalactose transaminase